MLAQLRTGYIVLSLFLVAGLLYQNTQLRWYRDRSVILNASWLSTSIRGAHDHLRTALESAEKGDYASATQELSEAQVQLARAEVAEGGYSLALDKRRFAGITTGATGFRHAIRLYGSLLRSNRFAIERHGWNSEVDTILRNTEHDLQLLRDALSEAFLVGANSEKLQAQSKSVLERLKVDGVN